MLTSTPFSFSFPDSYTTLRFSYCSQLTPTSRSALRHTIEQYFTNNSGGGAWVGDNTTVSEVSSSRKRVHDGITKEMLQDLMYQHGRVIADYVLQFITINQDEKYFKLAEELLEVEIEKDGFDDLQTGRHTR